MPDHVHWLVQLGDADELSMLVGRMKAVSAKALSQAGVAGRVWAKGFHDRALRKDEALKPAARYVIANPLRAGLVEKVGDYAFWDAVWI